MNTQLKRPNLNYIFADQLRYQSLGYTGDEKAITPNIDHLATESMSFDNAVSVSPVCAPYRSSLFTGKYPSSTGMVINELRMNPNHKCFGHVVTNAGYDTSYIGKWHLWSAGKGGNHNNDEQVPRARANYFGMLRLIDDQVKRFVNFLDAEGLRENTILIFTSDHGDFVGEYGLVRKGPEMPELLMRIPLLFHGPGIKSDSTPSPAHVSIVDIMPTLCEAIGVPLPVGVQGRSLWPIVSGSDYPEEEFASVYAEQGFGGLHYTANDDLSPIEEGCLADSVSFDCLNSWTQSGTMRMLRKDDWKLVFDMQGRGQLYNLSFDPVELENLYDNPEYKGVRCEMLAEAFAWCLRAQDPLPIPRRRYIMKTDTRNYWFS